MYKEQFIQLLRSCKRANTDKIIEYLESIRFFESPASDKGHLSCYGGLCQHSVSVCKTALDIYEALKDNNYLRKSVTPESIIIASLLHDICKCGVYKMSHTGQYRTDFSELPLGHGEKSVIMLLSQGFELSEQEMAAIRWHMNTWDLSLQSHNALGNYNAACDKYPLVILIQSADTISSRLLELHLNDNK